MLIEKKQPMIDEVIEIRVETKACDRAKEGSNRTLYLSKSHRRAVRIVAWKIDGHTYRS